VERRVFEGNSVGEESRQQSWGQKKGRNQLRGGPNEGNRGEFMSLVSLKGGMWGGAKRGKPRGKGPGRKREPQAMAPNMV